MLAVCSLVKALEPWQLHTATQRQVGEHGPQIEYYWHHIPKAPDSFDFLLQESQVKGGHVNFVRVCSLLQSLSSRLYGALVRRFQSLQDSLRGDKSAKQ